ncbi:HAD family hydrolase [Tengunoibacter tsumagoiensis]|uniref:Phosphoglycolate phosphatase n=1 Tax=Tengunoibacter tsumagoiensis TaxID=2014871 RepID=A0A401ZXW7_9CHLR|nr:HAD family hydrolase [Tengunoibacter tsumagoiensis]GCE11694.1 phosphoglycolate phosphatase [Tengunoibacter tsumagoiensis]
MSLKSIIFDLDGTLANTLPLCIKVYQQTLERYAGRPYSEQEITAHFGLTEGGIFQRLLPAQWESALDYYHQRYMEQHADCAETFPGILQALSLLQERGVKMALVTGKGSYTATYTLQYLGLTQYFSLVEAGSETAIVKAEAIRRILTTWQIEPSESAYLGDTDTDMQQAASAGVLPLAADWAATSTIHLLPTPVQTFHSVDEFIAWIQKTWEN